MTDEQKRKLIEILTMLDEKCSFDHDVSITNKIEALEKYFEEDHINDDIGVLL